MMKLFYNLQRGVGLLVFCTILLSACVNHISEEEEDSVNNGDIPLKFTADIHEVTYTRVAGNGFEENDEVGVFALVGSSTMKEERYADNLRFFRTSEKDSLHIIQLPGFRARGFLKFFREKCKLFFRGHFGQISEYTFAYLREKLLFCPATLVHVR